MGMVLAVRFPVRSVPTFRTLGGVGFGSDVPTETGGVSVSF